MMDPVCAHFGSCGGCSLQNLTYEEQLQKKENFVRSHLKDVAFQSFKPIIPSPDVRFYRNKMEYSFGDDRDIAIFERRPKPETGPYQVHLGLHPKKRFSLAVPTPECF